MKKAAKTNPAQILILGFLSFILVGTVLLMLPVATVNGISPVDALFTSTSAVCVTGLIVRDTSGDFTPFGQIVILFLIQIGGLGYMTSATILSLLLGKRIGLGERLIMKEALNVLTLEGVVRFTRAVLFTTLFLESAGAALLTVRFMADYGPGQAAYYGIFHSVSAFNNAGFSLFPDSMVRYRGDVVVNLVLSALVLIGGIGFLVLSDSYHYARKTVLRISLHTKVVVVTSVLLVTGGAVLILLFEYSNPETFRKMTLTEKILASFFGSVMPRTAGFNTLDYSHLRLQTLLMTIVLMFIGASPGSTGGGVKTTTFAIIIASLGSLMRSSADTVLFKRRIPIDMVSKSLLIVVLALILIATVSLIVLTIEERPYRAILFEVASAFGTVGLSVGDGGTRSLSALFTPLGKLFVCFAMFAGRLGPLTLVVAIIRKKEERLRYPEGRIVIG